MKDYIPYTYLIGWSKMDVWYYGSETARKSKIANPNNLWTSYFTSSKYVKRFRKENGEPDIVEVRKIFGCRDDAKEWEHNVIKRLGAVKSLRWLNKSDTRVHDRSGVPQSLETRRKMSIKRVGRKPNLGKHHSNETKQLMSEKRKQWLESEEGKIWIEAQKDKPSHGVPFTKERVLLWNKDPEIIKKRAAWHTGKKRSPETRKKISEARKRYLKEKVLLR